MSYDVSAGTVDPLRFHGDTNRPSRPHELAATRPVLGSGRCPKSSNSSPSGGSTSRGWAVRPVQACPGVPCGDRSAGQLPRLPAGLGGRAAVPRTVPGDTGKPLRRLDGRRLVRPFTTRFLPEERQVYRDASSPWGLVCKLFTSDRPGGAGSAALIGNRVAVTAAHCVPRTSSWWMRVGAAYYEGTSLHGAHVQSYVSDWRAFDTGNEVCGYDWAVMRLYEPLGSWLGFFGTNGYDDDWEDQPYWRSAGYRRRSTRSGRPGKTGRACSTMTPTPTAAWSSRPGQTSARATRAVRTGAAGQRAAAHRRRLGRGVRLGGRRRRVGQRGRRRLRLRQPRGLGTRQLALRVRRSSRSGSTAFTGMRPGSGMVPARLRSERDRWRSVWALRAARDV